MLEVETLKECCRVLENALDCEDDESIQDRMERALIDIRAELEMRGHGKFEFNSPNISHRLLERTRSEKKLNLPRLLEGPRTWSS